MAAAAVAAKAGLAVTLLDEQPGSGGQIYRAITAGGPTRGAVLGPDYLEGVALAKGMQTSGAMHLTGAVVWAIDPAAEGTKLSFSRKGRAEQITARRVLLATGALERPVPVPGWTLPGVMTAGAGQILLKASGVVAQRSVLAGSGPLLYLLAVQMARAGAPPLALVETQRWRDLLAASPRLLGGVRGWRTLRKGLALLAELRRSGVRRVTGASDLAVLGTDRTEALEFSAGGHRQHIACDTVMLHQGVVPNTQASRVLGLTHLWHEGQRAFVPQTDGWGETSRAGIFVAGDGAGIAGAKAAAAAGHLAGLQIACQLGAVSQVARDAAARAPRRALSAACGLSLRRLIRWLIGFWRPPTAPLCAGAKRSRQATCAHGPGWAALGPIKPRPLAA